MIHFWGLPLTFYQSLTHTYWHETVYMVQQTEELSTLWASFYKMYLEAWDIRSWGLPFENEEGLLCPVLL